MDSTRIHGICDSCREKIDWQTGNPFRSYMDEFAFDDVWPCCRYGFYARRIISSLKQGGKRYIARGIGRLIAERVSAEDELPDVLVPVPMHRDKFRRRGFNQAELIARFASEQLGIPVLQALIKPEATASMRLSDGRVRRSLLVNAFALREDASVSGLHVALVDDVTTTGSTADTCARVLRENGASRITLLCFAASAGIKSVENEPENDHADRNASDFIV